MLVRCLISWIQGFCEFPLAVYKLLLLVPLLRTPLQKILFPPEAIQFLIKVVWKLKASIFKNLFIITYLFQMCSKQSATNWLIGKFHTFLESPGTKWKDWESMFPLWSSTLLDGVTSILTEGCCSNQHQLCSILFCICLSK